MTQQPDFLALARAWWEQDPDETTRRALKDLIDAEDTPGLTPLFAGRLEFGTAGLRGELGPGPLRMNRVVVAQAAAGFGSWLLERTERPSVVIGYDARHMSERFARDSAEILASLGLRALLLPRALPTPVLAFAIRHLGVDGGIMVTASHNPPQDNGYKVYLDDSSQIVPPADAEISAQIAAVGRIDELDRSEDYERLGDEVEQAYIDAAVAIADEGPRDIVAVYTPMHGVGAQTFTAVVERAGFPSLHAVAEQVEPDPDFPTVAFPNPEEPGAMDLATALADRVDADVLIAHDPDADRCAVGVRDADGLTMLSGDEVGFLLADDLLRSGVTGTYACSIVSSTLLGRLAAAHGQPFAQTLTGFKWLGKLEGLAYGYEEALGYDVSPHLTLDKDGITAGLRALVIASRQKAEGATLRDRLDAIETEHGVHATGQMSARFEELADIAAAMTTLRTAPPASLAGIEVTEVHDMSEGFDGLPPTDGMFLRLGDDGRVIARPSGTEPKLKCYIEIVAEVAGEPVRDVRARARAQVGEIAAALTAFFGL